jgi:outer membrane protein OmpA-like peptidoglycan-associated protein
MKNLFLTVVFLLSALCMNAQKELAVDKQYPGDEGAQRVFLSAVAKQTNEKTSAVRTTWIANRPRDNWFISLRVGGSGILSDKNLYILEPLQWFNDKKDNVSPKKEYWHPAAGLSIGKWYSPVWGLRFDATYGSVQSFRKDSSIIGGTKYYGATVDYMINLKNLFLPYNPKGFFNPVLYFGPGFVSNKFIVDGHLDFDSKVGHFDLAAKAGLQLNFRLGRAVDLFLDGQTIVVPRDFANTNYTSFASSQYITNASIGLTYRFNYRSFIAAPLYDPAEIDALNREINELRNRPTVVCPPVVVCPEPGVTPPPPPTEGTTTVAPPTELTPVFFGVNSSVVRDNQLISVARAADYLLKNPGSKIELASYSDKKTGTPSYNLQLSKKRTDAVANVLVNKFGIDKSRLILKHYGDTVQPFPNDNDKNRVTIFIRPVK